MDSSKRNRQIVLGAISVCGVAAGVAGFAGRLWATPTSSPQAAPPATAGKSQASQRALTDDEKIVHVLNRLGFGPRPGDVQKVKAMGLQRYIDQQLAPQLVNDADMEQKLAAYTMLQTSDAQLAEMYQARAVAFLNWRKVRKQLVDAQAQTSAQTNSGAGTASDNADATVAKKGNQNLMALATPQEREELRAARMELIKTALPVTLAQEQFVAAKVLRAVESERQLQEVLVDFWSNHFNIDIRKQACGILKIGDDRDAIRPHVLGKFRDLLGASAKSPAMLVYLDNFQSTTDTPQLNRRHPAIGRRVLLMPNIPIASDQANSAQSPAPAQPANKRRGGLNENYAREIMELHTLGVDGGYTQKDVTEVARCFTGWGVGRVGANGMAGRMVGAGRFAAAGSFQFHPMLHDNGAKIVLGQVIPAGGGIQDGERVLDILAAHPATMKHISMQLCQRFVADNPPTSLVDKCVETWKHTDGDLRDVVRTIVTAPEFYASSAYRSKIKSPFEYAISSIRAIGGTYQNALAQESKPGLNIRPPQGGGYLYLNTTSIVGQVGTMGEPLFQYQAPTGYPEESQKWVSSGALISRMNFALALTGGKLADVRLPNWEQAQTSTKNPNQFIDRFSGEILHGSITPATRTTLLKQVGAATLSASASEDALTANQMAALLLGSPEFQRR